MLRLKKIWGHFFSSQYRQSTNPADAIEKKNCFSSLMTRPPKAAFGTSLMGWARQSKDERYFNECASKSLAYAPVINIIL